AGKIFSSQTGTENFPMFVPEVPTFNTPEEAREILRDLLIKATADRMSDGAVKGSALSGGLDSSIIAVIANQIDPTIPFFTVGIEGSLDIKNAQLMADYLDARDRIHIHIISEKEIEKAVPDAIWYLESFEEDCISGCIANFFASHLASQHTKCTLSGEGADELFGGYHLLKEIENGKERKAMMDKLVNIAYNTALRRLDRGWLSCSVNYRTPFLDSRVIALSQQIPVEWKIHGPTQVEKWILREAFRDMLPPEIADRRKLRFSAGTRVDDIMDTIASKHISQEEYEAHRTTKSGYQLNSPKELWYYKIFKDLFPDDTFEKQVDRWDPFK
ncbi:MAG: asparagine synthase-related protein, partial [Thermodesulfobacteriota bacterium]|nr:asparagine synthase-related protein [Thermodesulfobacteriota bacterium]